MADDTAEVKNISGVDRDVKLADGHWVSVPNGGTQAFDAELAAQLVEQVDNWEAATPALRKAVKAAAVADAADAKE